MNSTNTKNDLIYTNRTDNLLSPYYEVQLKKHVCKRGLNTCVYYGLTNKNKPNKNTYEG